MGAEATRRKTWGFGTGQETSPLGARGEVPASRRVRRPLPKKGGVMASQVLAEIVRTTEEAALAEIEAEAERESKRMLMLQQASSEERGRMEYIFALERQQASVSLMKLTSEHAAVVHARCRELKTSVDKDKILARKPKATVIREGERQHASGKTMPLCSRPVPAQFGTDNVEVLATWLAKSTTRAMRHAHVLPGVFPSKSNPSPYGRAQQSCNGLYQNRCTPLPGRKSPFSSARDASLLTWQSKGTSQAELVVFDSSTSTPMVRSRAVSREGSRDFLASRESSRACLDDTRPPPTSGMESTGSYLEQDASKESLRENSFEQAHSPMSFQRLSPQELEKSPLLDKSSSSEPRRMCSTSPLRDSSCVRRSISTTSLHSLLSASLSEKSQTNLGSPLTSSRNKEIQWDGTLRQLNAMVCPSKLDKTLGEQHVKLSLSETMAKAHVSAHIRKTIQQEVFLPTGTPLGQLAIQRPVSVHEMRDLHEESIQLLSASQPDVSDNGWLTNGKKHHQRYHSFHRRAVPNRLLSQHQSAVHYDNVRLRGIISKQMDDVVHESADTTTTIELCKNIARLADRDATSSLSLFPGILEVLFHILAKSASNVPRIAAAEALSRISKQAPVQEALITIQNLDQSQRFLELLAQFFRDCNNIKLTAEYAKLVANLCQTELGWAECTKFGLLKTFEALSKEDPVILDLYQTAIAGQDGLAKGPKDSVNLSSSSIGSSSPLAPSRKCIHRAVSAVSRKLWKPKADESLPVWERPPQVMGVDNSRWIHKKLHRTATRRHLE